MTLFLVELSPEVAGHLAVAIELYRRELRKAKGWAGPDQLDELGVAAQKNARRSLPGPDGSTWAEALAVLDTRPVRMLLTLDETADELRVSVSTVKRLIRTGKLTVVKVEAATRVTRFALEEYIAALGPGGTFRDDLITKDTKGIRMTTKHLSATVVDLKDAGNGGWTAVASTPSIDHDGESLAKGCFLPLPGSVPVHVDHSLKVEDCVGRARPYYSGENLMLDGTFASNAKAQHVRQLVIEGIVDSMSVVFVDPVRKNIGGVQTVTKGTLKAVDFVTIGANSDARLVSARGFRVDPPADLVLLKARIAMCEAALALGDSGPRPAPQSTKSILDDLADIQQFLADLSRKADR